MNNLNLEKYVKNKIEYDKEIRRLDLDIVAKSYQLYNIKSRAKSANIPFFNYDLEESKLKSYIKNIEEQKQIKTNKIMQEFDTLKQDLIVQLDNGISKNAPNKDELFIKKMSLNRIVDVYFDVEKLQEITNSIHFDDSSLEKNQEEKLSEKQFTDLFVKVADTKPVFDVKKQRVVDFENLLKHIYKLSKDYRKLVEEKISKYISNYSILNDFEPIQIEIDKNKEEYINKFNESINKFEKLEKIDELKKKIEDIKSNIKNIEIENSNMVEESTILKNKVQELQEIYLVSSSATKIMNKFSKIEADNKNNAKNSINVSDDVFEEIRKLAHDERMKHIIDVSKWTKNIENKLKNCKIKEEDFQSILYLIRQTEDICNFNYEKVTNAVINLCDCYISLEQVEENNKTKKMILEENKTVAQTLRDGINSIKRKYSKIPFIGRKVMGVLETKALNA